MTGTLRCPRFTIACSAGKIFFFERSPVAPKKTRASDEAAGISPSPRSLGPPQRRPLVHRDVARLVAYDDVLGLFLGRPHRVALEPGRGDELLLDHTLHSPCLGAPAHVVTDVK